jgi:hypothetical protein
LNKVNPRGYPARQDWLWWAHTFLARRAEDADDIELLEDLEEQARELADVVEARWQAEGL